jgi:hypothetical protein
MDNGRQWVGFCIGTETGPRLRVTYIAATGIPEEGWHRFRVEAAVPGFTARFEFESLLDVIAGFRDNVLAMSETLRGAAALRFTEEDVRIHGEMSDRLGHVLWRIELRHGVWDPVTLRFDIQDDQTTLRKIAAQCNSLLKGANARPV